MYRTVECPNCFHQAHVDPTTSSGAVKCLKCGELISTEEIEPAAYGLGVQPCPGCGKDCAPGAVVCIECGYDFQNRKKHKTRVQPYQKMWSEPMPLPIRFALFVLLSGASMGLFFVRHHYAWIAPGVIVLLLGLSLGTCRRVTLSKNPDGQVRLKIARWFFFIRWSRRTLNLRKFKNVVLEYKGTQTEDDWDWDGGSTLGWSDSDYGLIWFGWLGLEFFHVKIRPLGIGDLELVWRTNSEKRAREIGDALCKVGGLHYG